MKTFRMASVLLLCLAACPLAAQEAAQEGPPLGKYHFYFEYGAMVMQHVTWSTDDAGIHLGLAGYRHMGKNWYLGAELGVGASLMFFGDASDIGMIEVNAKRAFPLGNTVRFDFGGGLSYNHVTFDDADWFGPDTPVIDDWVLGVQVLSNANLKLGPVLLGAHVKYMLTQDVAGVQEVENLDKGWDYTNLTFGIQCGFLLR